MILAKKLSLYLFMAAALVVGLAVGSAADEYRVLETISELHGLELNFTSSFPATPKVMTFYLWEQVDWRPASRATATRDGSNRVSEVLNESYNVGQAEWRPSSRIEYSYSMLDVPDTQTVSYFFGSVWTLVDRTIYTYDAQGRVINQLGQVHTGTDWIDQTQYIYTLDGQGRVAHELYQQWNQFQSQWEDVMQTTNTYDNGLLSTSTSQFWFGTDWMNSERSLFTYDNGRETQEMWQGWNGSSWEDSYRYTTSYMQNRGPMGTVVDTYTGETNGQTGWRFDYRDICVSYDPDDRVLIIENQTWNTDWVNTARSVFEWDSPTDVEDEGVVLLPNGVALAQNYPNPFNAGTQIAFSLPTAANVTIAVFDLLGRRVIELHRGRLPSGDHRVEWNGADAAGKTVASGVYFYRLETEDGALSRKMIMVK